MSLVFLALKNIFLIVSITFVLVILSAVFLIHMELLAKYGYRLNTTFFQKAWLTRILDGFTLLKPRQLWTTLIFTIVFHGVLVLQMFYLINAFNGITISDAFIGTSATMFVKSLLPISLGDLGIREAGSIYFFSIFGISQAAALNASLLLFVINILIPSMIGTYFLKYQQLSFSAILQSLKKKNLQ